MMFFPKALAFGFAFSLWPIMLLPAAQAAGYQDPLGQEMRRFRERQLFLEARKEARTGKLSKLEPMLDQLTSYPLKPYLEFEAIKARSSTADSKVLTFVDNHPDIPISQQLMTAFSQYRMRQGQPESFLTFHNPDHSDQDMLCYRAAALWALDRLDEAMQVTEKLWLKGQSQPKQCDQPFVRWRKEGGLTRELAWQRWELATLAGETRLARYLERYLSDEQRSRAKKLNKLLQRPGQSSRYRRLDIMADENRALIDHAIERVTKKTPDKALTLIAALEVEHDIKPEHLLPHYQAVALRLIRSNKSRLDTLDLPQVLQGDPELLEAELVASIVAGHLKSLPGQIAKLPPAQQLELRWRYWQARALLSQETPETERVARSIFESLAAERDYYGHMAALWLNQPASIADQSSSIPHEDLLDLAASPAAQRMIELRALGDITAARREWFMLVSDFSETELHIAAALANQWHWHDIAIATLAQSKAWDEVKIRFPMAYSDLFAHQALKHGVPMPLAMAVARRESGFWNEARSPVGAEGLMQLMPSTARLVVKGLDLPAVTTDSLNDPAVNIQLGTAYLGQMLQQFNDNRVLALAAYNAGPSRVQRWKQRKAPIDAWIESIPFKETRAYVKAGLLYAGIYRQLNGGVQPIVFPNEIIQFNPSDPLLEGLQPLTTRPSPHNAGPKT
jgi:soluble lytic murein transglycosylase